MDHILLTEGWLQRSDQRRCTFQTAVSWDRISGEGISLHFRCVRGRWTEPCRLFLWYQRTFGYMPAPLFFHAIQQASTRCPPRAAPQAASSMGQSFCPHGADVLCLCGFLLYQIQCVLCCLFFYFSFFLAIMFQIHKLF